MLRILAAAVAVALLAAAPAVAAPPPNDDLADAEAIAGTTFDGTTDESTREALEPHNAPGDEGTVWFSWQAPSTGLWTVDLCGPGTAYNTSLGIYPGSGSFGTLLFRARARNGDAAQCENAASQSASAASFKAT